VGVDHYENFPVASLLCPPALRPAITAIYGFARTADDIADEGDATPAQRLRDLADYRRDLDGALLRQTASRRWPRVFGPLARAHERHHLPLHLLRELLSAFEQDAHNPPCADRAALLDYCRRSANPVGRLLLHLYGIDDARSLQQSDAICTALQLINFWQDLGADQRRGRNYLPRRDRAAHGRAPTDDAPGTGAPLADSPALRRLLRELCDWARDLMRQGAPLALRVPGRAGWELRLVVQGGLRILDKIARLDHDTLHTRPTLTAADAPLLLWRALRMSDSSP
jgi:squalene synthase HpnC